MGFPFSLPLIHSSCLGKPTAFLTSPWLCVGLHTYRVKRAAHHGSISFPHSLFLAHPSLSLSQYSSPQLITLIMITNINSKNLPRMGVWKAWDTLSNTLDGCVRTPWLKMRERLNQRKKLIDPPAASLLSVACLTHSFIPLKLCSNIISSWAQTFKRSPLPVQFRPQRPTAMWPQLSGTSYSGQTRLILSPTWPGIFVLILTYPAPATWKALHSPAHPIAACQMLPPFRALLKGQCHLP